MSTLVLTDPTLTLAISGCQYSLRDKGKQLCKLPFSKVTRIIAHHGVNITHKALQRLTLTGTPVIFLDREVNIASRLSPSRRQDPRLTLHLARAYDNPETRAGLARKWVTTKINNSIATIQAYRSNDKNPVLASIQKELKKSLPRLEQPQSLTPDQLLGQEGLASRIYFSAFPHLFKCPWTTFQGRIKRPPTDPINATLSYVYAILTHEIELLLDIIGIDSSIGFLHVPTTGRPSLALDMIEPFRSTLADRFVLKLFNLGMLKPEHFKQINGYQTYTHIENEGKHIIFNKLQKWYREMDTTEPQPWTSPLCLIEKEVNAFHQHLTQDTLPDFTPYQLSV